MRVISFNVFFHVFSQWFAVLCSRIGAYVPARLLGFQMYHDKIIQTLLHNAVCRVLTSTSQSKHRGYCRKGDLRIWYTSCSNPVNTRCHGVFSNYLFNSLTAQKSESTGGLIRKEPLSEGRAFLKRCSSHVLWRKFLDSCASNFQSQWQVTCNDYYLKILQRDPYILMFSHCICQFDGIKKMLICGW